jgi:VanZ family protein
LEVTEITSLFYPTRWKDAAMSPDLRSTLRRSPAPLAFMGLIFFLSAQPDLSSGLGAWDFVLRKLAHITEYGVLTGLWFWALRPSVRPPLNAALGVAGAIALVYAGTDEYHQHFVRGRHAAVRDVLIDLVGIAIAAFVIRRLGASRASG